MDFGVKFDQGLGYQPFLDRYASADERTRWDALFGRIRLSDPQAALLGAFTREMKVLVFAGTWCGDCVNQCPIFEHFSAVNAAVRIRYFDRDDHPDLAEQLLTCGAPRVPGVLFLSEDNHVCSRYGDRTLAKYREMAAELDGAACPTGIGVDDALVADVVQEWLNEFERVQLMLRTSGRLRELHGD